MALEHELQTYRNNLPNLLGQEGKFVVIHGEQIAGVWETYEDALKAGYDHFGLEPFLVKKIQAVEKPQVFTRNIRPCLS